MNDFKQHLADSEIEMKPNAVKGLAEMYPHIPAKELIHLSKQAFWDTDFNSLDYYDQANTIIRRVFDYGTWEDMVETVSFYGEEKVKEALVTTPYLKELTLIFVSKLFNIPIQKFKCSTTRQFHPIS
jgi:hypothetical protein